MFFLSKTFGKSVKKLHVLEDLKINVSDHLLVYSIIDFYLNKVTTSVNIN